MWGMSVISSVLGLQELSSSTTTTTTTTIEREGREVRTLVWFLRETTVVMDGGVDRERWGRRKSFKERLGLKGMACCGGATWGVRPSTMSVRDDDDDDDELEAEDPQQQQVEVAAIVDHVGQIPAESNSDLDCVGQVPVSSSGMNLATALAVERLFRSTQDSDGPPGVEGVGPTSTSTRIGTAPGTPLRVSLMRLLEESSDGVGIDGGEMVVEKEKGGGGGGSDSVCCVCMGRKKGSAFIPCGHTFCRVCSREMWLNRGSCPLCNRSILEILDIF